MSINVIENGWNPLKSQSSLPFDRNLSDFEIFQFLVDWEWFGWIQIQINWFHHDDSNSDDEFLSDFLIKSRFDHNFSWNVNLVDSIP